MSKVNNPIGFELDDILTRVIPGAIPVIFIVWVSEIINIFKLTTTELTIVIISSFILGEIIELFRYQDLSVPRSFSRLLYRKTRKLEHLGIIDTALIRLYTRFFGDLPEPDAELTFWSKEYWLCPLWSYKSRYWFETEYDGCVIKELHESNPLPNDEIVPSQLYFHLQKLVGNKLDKEAMRRRTLSKFKSNLNISLFLVIVIFIPFAMENSNIVELFRQLTIIEALSLVFSLIFILVFIQIILTVVNLFLNKFQKQHMADLFQIYLYEYSD